MDKFIDKQIRKLSFQYMASSPTRVLTEEDCKMLIEKFCKAQRHACLRRHQEEFNKRIYGSNSVISILTAEIEKQDYNPAEIEKQDYV